ncbi:MAG TPA: glycosyltransferase [Candidatus Udaeobacter sp.]|jgi:glycosyltransferase EpsJ|nr:glycosyltransferase [Candidatus Udaeobacter sp.]
MDCAISVIVPIFNAEKWLGRCINRILHQPFRQIELLLVNDGSTDRSGAICEEFAARDARIKLLHKPNGGTSSTKNAGLKAAIGKYVAFLDADDEIDELFFVKLYATAEEHACDVVISGYETVPTKLSFSPRFRLHTLMNGKDFVLSAVSIHSGNDLCFAWRSLFLRTSLVSRGIQFHEGLTIGEDTVFNLEALLTSERVYAIPDPLYFYTVNNLDSLMSTPYKPYLEQNMVLQYQLRKQLSEHFGLLAHDHYRRDMAAYHIRSIYGMLIRNFKNSPNVTAKEDVARIVTLELVTDSTKELGFLCKCGSTKEYIYYLALKFKLAAILFSWEFGSPFAASCRPFRIAGKSKRVDNRTIR